VDLKKKISEKGFHWGFIFAVISALFFSLNIPVTKALVDLISPYWLASLLYFGAGVGTLIFHRFTKKISINKIKINHQINWFALMIILDIAAPIFFLLGVKETNGSLVGLLANAELLFTMMFALIWFKEKLRSLSWVALGLILFGLFLTNLQNGDFSFSLGQAWIILATLLWGLENNVSKKLSVGDPFFVVIVKGIGTGVGTFIVALLLGEIAPNVTLIVIGLISGFVIYGGSLIFYVYSQRSLGAAKVQMIQSFGPVVGGLIAYLIFQESFTLNTMFGYLAIVIALTLIGIEVNREHKLQRISTKGI
jgi:drug/metabolite transporter (DMT)-like permease